MRESDDPEITFDPSTHKYKTAWGWMTFTFDKVRVGDVKDIRIMGPHKREWFDRDAALRSAGNQHGLPPGMSLARAIHQQYLAYLEKRR